MGGETTGLSGGGDFPSTRWTVILRAQGRAGGGAEARAEALGALIEAYWRPLYFYLRGTRMKVEEAKDVTQAFFATLLEKDFLKVVAQEKGRFRHFLLAAIKHFAANERDKIRTLKRGGGRKIFSLDYEDAESRFTREPSHEVTPEKLYLRRWAQELSARALQELEDECPPKKAKLFALLKPHLAGAKDVASLSEATGLSPSNVKVTLHRMRQRYAELLRAAVRDTVETEADVDDELRELLDAL